MNKSRQGALEEKPHYEILDGLRGVAAIMVVLFHLFETYATNTMTQIINHGYLAVDFFFVLSGFVIGYAYDDRWGRITTWDFFKRRLIRLQPMVVAGSAIGMMLFYFTGADVFPLVMGTPWWWVVIAFLIGSLMIPAPPSFDLRGWQETYSLNGPAWSLTWEYIANVLYAVLVRRFSRPVLAMFVGLSSLLTINLCFNIDIFHCLDGRGEAIYTVIGGWSITGQQVLIAVTRLLYPFFLGLLMYRMGWKISCRNGLWRTSLALIVVLAMPHLGGGGEYRWLNGLYCAAAILFVMPCIVAAGVGGELKGKRTISLCRWLGAISYPLYITHYPWVYMQMSWARRNPEMPLGAHVIVFVGSFMMSLLIAYSLLKLYDLPVRGWLTEKFRSRRKVVSGE